MTRVDFYVLLVASLSARQILACRLAEKAYRLRHKILIRTESPVQNKTMDDLLWTFRAGSFVPHITAKAYQTDSIVPVVLSDDESPDCFKEILINLSNDLPKAYTRFERVIELIDQSPDIRNAGRERYRRYKEQGLAVETHKINSAR